MNKLITGIIIFSMVFPMTMGRLFAQKKNKARFQIEYLKDFNKTEHLKVTLKVKVKKYVPVNNLNVQLYNVVDTSRYLLDEIQTDEEGKVLFTLNEDSKIIKDPSGVVSFQVEYAGNDTIKTTQKTLEIKQSDLVMSFFQKDSVKSIKISAQEIGIDDELNPLEGVKVSLFVKGTFSLYEFAKEKTDENGIVNIDFPTDMPGDTAGILSIVAKIVDHKTYGTVETHGKINWGKAIQPEREKKRGLGDTDAPLWMVYTLIILLSAVWLHYLYVIFLIIKIKLVK